MLTVRSASPEETVEIGRVLSEQLLPGDFLNLNGSLGAGKTLLVKGVGQGLGLDPDLVTSPTFSIMNEYTGIEPPLYHFDLYRLQNDLELEQIGYEDYFYGSGITVVEWGDRFRYRLPEQRVDIVLEVLATRTANLSLWVKDSEASRSRNS